MGLLFQTNNLTLIRIINSLLDLSKPENEVLMKELSEVEYEFESRNNIDHDDIINVTLANDEPNLKRKFSMQIIQATILLAIITTAMGLFVGFSEDPDFQKDYLQFSQINITEKPKTTTTMTTTTGKCSSEIISSILFNQIV